MATISDLATKLGSKVQPSDTFYQFSTTDLQDEITDALLYMDLDPDTDVATLTKLQETLVILKARSSCYYALAGKHAENMRFRLEKDEFFGNMPVDQYTKLGDKYEQRFQDMRGIQVHTVTRTQTGTGLKAPYYAGDKP